MILDLLQPTRLDFSNVLFIVRFECCIYDIIYRYYSNNSSSSLFYFWVCFYGMRYKLRSLRCIEGRWRFDLFSSVSFWNFTLWWRRNCWCLFVGGMLLLCIFKHLALFALYFSLQTSGDCFLKIWKVLFVLVGTCSLDWIMRLEVFIFEVVELCQIEIVLVQNQCFLLENLYKLRYITAANKLSL